MTRIIIKLVMPIVAPICLLMVYLGMFVGDTLNGDVIAYIGRDESGDAVVRLYDLRTSHDIALASDFPPIQHLHWSPDGEQLLYVTLVGQSQRLIVMNADGSQVHDIAPLSDRNSAIIEPRWLSDGDIVYLQSVNGQRFTYLVGSLVYNIPEYLDDEDPRYGEYVAQLERDAGQIINNDVDSVSLSIELIGGNQWAIVRWEDNERHILRTVADVTVQNRSVLVLSPDREKVIFSDLVGGRIELLVMDTDGNNVHQITTNGGLTPVWRP